MCSVIFSQWSRMTDVTAFGGFGNSMCKRVLDLLQPGDLRLGQVVIE